MFAYEDARKLAIDGEDGVILDAMHKAHIFNVLSFVLNLGNIFVFIMQTKSLGKEALIRVWSIVDFIIIMTNIFVFLDLVIEIDISFIRVT